MKNFIQRETMNFDSADLESYCYFLAVKFLTTYPHTAGAQVSASEIPYERLPGSGVSFVPSGPDKANSRIEVVRDGEALRMPEARSGIKGFRLLRLNGSAFTGFVRDQYTTLPDIENRPLHMWLDLQWTYVDEKVVFSSGAVTAKARRLVRAVFDEFESGSIQQLVYQIGTTILAEIPAIAQVDLEANNRTWDSIAEHESLGVFTDPRPPYGCIGLTIRR
jgi:urate oxidase